MIIQGDNNVILEFVCDADISLVDKVIECRLLRDGQVIKKEGFVKDINICQVILTSEDLSVAGTYQVQISVISPDNSKISSPIIKFPVQKRIPEE